MASLHIIACVVISSSFSSLTLASGPRRKAEAGSEDNLVGYIEDPNGRGTISLILSCLLTLILCVWSALHLNVPAPRSNWRTWIWLNARWIFAGIYCPELVVFAAWRQWASAKILQRNVELLVQEEATKGRDEPRGLWTMAHSFFACAGGFAFELEMLNHAIVNRSGAEDRRSRRLTLTARGVMLLAHRGELPSITKEEIDDKSKANDLAKAAVLIQATWMLIQVIGRLVARLPVTLLEVNTVAHVVCAFAMYGFWWHKPLLPSEPIILRDDRLAPLASFMYCSSEMSGQTDATGVKSKTAIKTLFARLNFYSSVPEIETLCFRSSISNQIPGPRNRGCDERESQNQQVSIDPKYSSYHQAAGELVNGDHAMDYLPLVLSTTNDDCLKRLEYFEQKEQSTAFFERRPRVKRTLSADEATSPSNLRRRALVSMALQGHDGLAKDRTLFVHSVSNERGVQVCTHLRPEQLVADHIQNWPSNDLLRDVNGLIVGMVLWFANFCYGGLHAAAWNEHFPSAAEKWMWRGSAVYISFCGGLWVILNLAVSRWPRLNAFWEKWMDGEKSLAEGVILGTLVIVCGFSLIVARLYIVVEAFVSIRELPGSAYETPEWVELFPHF